MSHWMSNVNSPIDVEVLEESALAMAQSTIQKAINEANITKADLARAMSINRSGVTRILSGSHNLTVKTMARALAACGCEVRFNAVPIEWNWQVINQPCREACREALSSNLGSATVHQQPAVA
jgi:transcriptional regulator with XRE-family HTH domain